MKPISRRTVLRGAGVCIALPFLEAMQPRKAQAQAAPTSRFIAFFAPNGTDPGAWHPQGEGALTANLLTPCLKDMTGFAAEREWPEGQSIVNDVTLVNGVNHQGICTAIHAPAMALCAYHDGGEPSVPTKATLDQLIAQRIGGVTAFRNLNFSATRDTELTQGYISFRDNEQPDDVHRDPAKAFDALFSNVAKPNAEAERIRLRRQSVLDFAREDAKRLNLRLGAADKARVEQHLDAVFELEKQIRVTTTSCTVPTRPVASSNMHTKFKQMVDLSVIAMICDLTRVITLQYSNSWDLDFRDYALADGVADWSDHFVSHKLGDRDRATDLDGLPNEEAMRIANARVVNTSRFKVRRFAYLLNALKAAQTASGTLLDESLVLYTSENGDGDSHGRQNMPIMLAGHVGGFKTGRRVLANGKPTGGLHASILNYFGIETAQHGDPVSGPIAGL